MSTAISIQTQHAALLAVYKPQYFLLWTSEYWHELENVASFFISSTLATFYLDWVKFLTAMELKLHIKIDEVAPKVCIRSSSLKIEWTFLLWANCSSNRDSQKARRRSMVEPKESNCAVTFRLSPSGASGGGWRMRSGRRQTDREKTIRSSRWLTVMKDMLRPSC